MKDDYKKTLIYFAQNYSLKEIALLQEKQLRTIEKRLEILKVYYTQYYNKAFELRLLYKRLKHNLSNPKQLNEDLYS